jgi:pimeloyl-ACP methyl ester carboxylesterase
MPVTQYARTGDGAHIAYQVLGDGPPDIVYASSFLGHIEVSWEYPPAVRFYERMAGFSRLAIFDRRGTGLSDPLVGGFTIEDRSADLGAVIDAVGMSRPVLLGSSEGGMTCTHYAALNPDRVAGLILFSTTVAILVAEDAPWSWSREFFEAFLNSIEPSFSDPTGTGVVLVNPSLADDADARAWYARYFRLSASPWLVRTLLRGVVTADVRGLFPLVRAPTLVLHRRDESWTRVEGSRYVADHIPGAKLVELAGTDHYIWEQNAGAVVEEIEEFVTGVRREPDTHRRVKSLVFTDIVASTARALELGDERWRRLLERHESLVRRQIERFDGRFVQSTGDGALATFDSRPGRSHVRWRFVKRSAAWIWRCASGFTRARLTCAVTAWAVSQFTSRHEWPSVPRRPRSLFRGRSLTWSPGRILSSATVESTSSRACPAPGVCSL